MLQFLWIQIKKARMLRSFGFKWIDAWKLSVHFVPIWTNVPVLQALSDFRMVEAPCVCCGQDGWILTSAIWPQNGRLLLSKNGKIV